MTDGRLRERVLAGGECSEGQNEQGRNRVTSVSHFSASLCDGAHLGGILQPCDQISPQSG